MLTCFQEFLRGPCEEGDQYINVQEEDSVEPKCLPTNCDNKNQIRYQDVCVTIPKCKENQGIKFASEKDLEPVCVDGLGVGDRTQLISGSKSCKPGKRFDARGNCKKTVGSKKNRKKRKGTSRRRTNVREYCCKG